MGILLSGVAVNMGFLLPIYTLVVCYCKVTQRSESLWVWVGIHWDWVRVCTSSKYKSAVRGVGDLPNHVNPLSLCSFGCVCFFVCFWFDPYGTTLLKYQLSTINQRTDKMIPRLYVLRSRMKCQIMNADPKFHEDLATYSSSFAITSVLSMRGVKCDVQTFR